MSLIRWPRSTKCAFRWDTAALGALNIVNPALFAGMGYQSFYEYICIWMHSSLPHMIKHSNSDSGLLFMPLGWFWYKSALKAEVTPTETIWRLSSIHKNARTVGTSKRSSKSDKRDYTQNKIWSKLNAFKIRCYCELIYWNGVMVNMIIYIVCTAIMWKMDLEFIIWYKNWHTLICCANLKTLTVIGEDSRCMVKSV